MNEALVWLAQAIVAGGIFLVIAYIIEGTKK